MEKRPSINKQQDKIKETAKNEETHKNLIDDNSKENENKMDIQLDAPEEGILKEKKEIVKETAPINQDPPKIKRRSKTQFTKVMDVLFNVEDDEEDVRREEEKANERVEDEAANIPVNNKKGRNKKD